MPSAAPGQIRPALRIATPVWLALVMAASVATGLTTYAVTSSGTRQPERPGPVPTAGSVSPAATPTQAAPHTVFGRETWNVFTGTTIPYSLLYPGELFAKAKSDADDKLQYFFDTAYRQAGTANQTAFLTVYENGQSCPAGGTAVASVPVSSAETVKLTTGAQTDESGDPVGDRIWMCGEYRKGDLKLMFWFPMDGASRDARLPVIRRILGSLQTGR